MNKQPAVYILTNKPLGSLYVGVTSDLIARVWQHKSKQVPGFTRRYNLDKLVYFELTESMASAIAREKQIKAGSRRGKVRMIETLNLEWLDLYPDLCR